MLTFEFVTIKCHFLKTDYKINANMSPPRSKGIENNKVLHQSAYPASFIRVFQGHVLSYKCSQISFIFTSYKGVFILFMKKIHNILYQFYMVDTLTFITLWANSADDWMVIYIFFFLPENRFWHLTCQFLFSGKIRTISRNIPNNEIENQSMNKTGLFVR